MTNPAVEPIQVGALTVRFHVDADDSGGSVSVHGFTNGRDADARFLAVISPGLLGSDYFRDVADVLAAGGPPDPELIGEVMRRHGLTPAPPA